MTGSARGEVALPRATDPKLRQRSLSKAHAAFVEGDRTSADSVRPLVLDSWQRSYLSGVDHRRAAASEEITGDALEQARAGSPLAAIMPVVRSLLVDHATDGEFVVAVGDAQGQLLWVEGDHATRDMADTIGFRPGSTWGEDALGTNAPGTALRLGAPVQIFAAEHFVQSVHQFSCTAVPIRDRDSGDVIGVIDVTGGNEVASPQALALVGAAAAAAQATLATTVAASLPRQRVGTIRLEVLGHDHASLIRGEQRTRLSRRHSEIMLLLALHPKGLTADRLSVMLSDQEMSPITIRAELTRLRRLLGNLLASRPYRLSQQIEVDLSAVNAALDAGSLRRALRDYQGSVLPSSESPAITETREDLAARIRRAALATTDADLLYAYANRDVARDDVEVQRALMAVLPKQSRRRPSVQARLDLIDRRMA